MVIASVFRRTPPHCEAAPIPFYTPPIPPTQRPTNLENCGLAAHATGVERTAQPHTTHSPSTGVEGRAGRSSDRRSATLRMSTTWLIDRHQIKIRLLLLSHQRFVFSRLREKTIRSWSARNDPPYTFQPAMRESDAWRGFWRCNERCSMFPAWKHQERRGQKIPGEKSQRPDRGADGDRHKYADFRFKLFEMIETQGLEAKTNKQVFVFTTRATKISERTFAKAVQAASMGDYAPSLEPYVLAEKFHSWRSWCRGGVRRYGWPLAKGVLQQYNTPNGPAVCCLKNIETIYTCTTLPRRPDGEPDQRRPL